MTGRKFTDEEVMDSLRYHKSRALARCCQCAYLEYYENCTEMLAKDALDLINRQKAEIERLTILAYGSKIKTIGKFVPRAYQQLTIDDMEETL